MRALQRPATSTLTRQEAAEVAQIACTYVPPCHHSDYGSFVAGCRRAARALPRHIRDWQKEVRRVRVGLLRNVPVDQSLPPTPLEKGAVDDLPLSADRVHGVLSCLFGSIYTFSDKIRPRYIQNLYPARGDECTQLGTSIVKLEWHVEDACHAARADWVCLLCLRGDPRVCTSIARAKDLRFGSRIAHVLRQRRFKIRLDETFAAARRPRHVVRPILFGPKDNPQIIFDPAYTEAEQVENANALAAVSAAADEERMCLTLKTGDYLVFDNRRVVHGRTAFRPRMDGTDRWLKRALVLDPRRCAGRVFRGVFQVSSVDF
jgi:L-asparagine oxygenase